VGFRVLHSADASWKASRQLGVMNCDLASQLHAADFGARLWRLRPGEASTKHRHAEQTELYVVLSGLGRMRVDEQLLTVDPLSAVLVEPASVRQIFNDGELDSLWLVVGAPREAGSSADLNEGQLAYFYPDGPSALPPELNARRRPGQIRSN
jgi:mannose-6-phosphate isomerase-like protein (cupin superfamily)